MPKKRNPKKRPVETAREFARRVFAQHAREEIHVRIRTSLFELVSHLIENLGLTKTQQERLRDLRPQTVNLLYQQGKVVSGKHGGAETIPISGKALKSIYRNTLKELDQVLRERSLRAEKRRWLTELQKAIGPTASQAQQIADEKELTIPTENMEKLIENSLLCHLDLIEVILGKEFGTYYSNLTEAMEEFAIKPEK